MKSHICLNIRYNSNAYTHKKMNSHNIIYKNKRNELNGPVLEHGPRSLAYAQVFEGEDSNAE